MKLILASVAFCVGMGSLQILWARRRRTRSEADLLLAIWETARERRRLWEAEHLLFLNFYDPAYQDLWETEIFAEAHWLFYTQSGQPSASRLEYLELVEKQRLAIV